MDNQAETQAAAQKPVTLKDRLIGLAIGIGLIALGVAMWVNPELSPAEGASVGRHRTGLWIWLIDLVWSRPGGAVSGLLGLLVAYGSFVRKAASTSDTPP